MTTHQFQPLLMSCPIRSQMVTAVPSSPSSSQSTGFVQPTVQMTPVQSTPSSMTNIQQPQSQHQNFNLQLQNIQFCPAAIPQSSGPQLDTSMQIPFVPVSNQPIFIGSSEYHSVMNQPALPPPMTNFMSRQPGSCPNMTFAYIPGHLVPIASEEFSQFMNRQVSAGNSSMDLTQSLCPPHHPCFYGNFINPMRMQSTAFVGMEGWHQQVMYELVPPPSLRKVTFAKPEAVKIELSSDEEESVVELSSDEEEPAEEEVTTEEEDLSEDFPSCHHVYVTEDIAKQAVSAIPSSYQDFCENVTFSSITNVDEEIVNTNMTPTLAKQTSAPRKSTIGKK